MPVAPPSVLLSTLTEAARPHTRALIHSVYLHTYVCMYGHIYIYVHIYIYIPDGGGEGADEGAGGVSAFGIDYTISDLPTPKLEPYSISQPRPDICIYVYTHARTHTHTHTHTHTYVCIYEYTYKYLYISIHKKM